MQVRWIVLLSGILLTSLVQGQSKVQWLEKMDLDDEKLEEPVQYPLPDGGYYSLELKFSVGRLVMNATTFNKQGKNIKTKKYPLPDHTYITFIKVGDKNYLITIKTVRKNPASYFLVASYFDPSNDKEEPDQVTLGSVRIYPDGGKILHKVNSKGSNLFVLEAPAFEKGNERWTIRVFDAGLKEISARSMELDVPNELLYLRNTFVDNNGNMMVTCDLYTEKPTLLGKTPPHTLKIYTISSTGTRANNVEIPLNGIHYSQVRFFINNDDTFTCYGLFGKENDRVASGVYHFSFNNYGALISELKKRDFPASLLEQADRRYKFRKKEEVPNLILDDLRVFPDGRYQFIAEQRDSEYKTIVYSTTSVSGTSYNLDDIVIFSIYDDPAKDWYTLIRKRQSSFGEMNYLSYTFTYDKEGKLYILYNDLPENIGLDSNTEPENLKAGRDKMATVLATVDVAGKLNKSILFTKKEVDHWFVPAATKRNENKLILTAYTKKTYRQGTLEIE